MINKEYAKKVYNGLVKRGYTSEDLGDEAKFVERMGKETNRRYLYDLVNKRGDANLGTFEGFEKRMGVTSKPEAGGIVGPMPFDAGIPSTPQTQSAQQPISNFGEGVAQGADALYQGGKNAVAEYSNIITGSQRDAQLGLDILSARSEGVIPEFDVNSELDAYNKSEYEKRLKDIEDRRAAATSTTAGRWKQLAKDLFVGREEDNLRRENLSVADYLHRKRAFEAIEQALKDSAGDVEKAKKLLAERAKIESWGDAKGREAREAMSQHRPTEGAAWVGEMIPQMAGTAAGLAASLHPATRPLAGVLGKSNLLGLTISSMGSQMAEARNDGASEGDVFKAGALNAAVEAGSEYVPFSRYFGRLVKNTGDVIGRVVGESLEHSPRAKKELQDLLKKGSKELGKLFTGKNAMEFAKDITEEAASEFVAEFGNALIPLIYSNPELYPTLLQAVENGWEGAKGGLFMGIILGSGSKLASYYAHDKRRKQQGFVVLAETSDGDVVEYAGKDENGNAVVIDGNGEQLTIDSDELGEAVRVSYNEFKTGERGAFRDRMEESFNDGKSAQTKEDKEYIGLSYEYALRRLEELSGLSAEDIKNGFPNAVAVYEAADDAVKANNIEYAKALNDYANAWARLEGSNNAIEEVVEQQSAASDAEVDALSDNGVIRPATLRSGEEVFVVGGNIAVDNNGGIVYEESDAQIVVNVNGERKVVGIAEIGAVGETVNSEEEKISRRGRIESDINNKHNSDINGWKELIPGESYNVLFDGTPFELMVVGRNENGELLISGDGGKSTEPISEADFQNSIREYELRQITVAELNERFAGKLKVLNAMLANIRSEGNEDKAAANYSEVENMVAELDGELPDGYKVVAENGNYIIADALVSANENEASAERAEGEKGSEGEKVDEESVPAEAAVPVGPEKVASEETAALSPAEQRKQKRAEVAKRIPMEGKKRLWTMAKPEDVAEYISLLESDPAKQAAMVDGYLAEIAEKQAKLSPIEAAELNEDVEFWNGVKGLLAPVNNEVGKTEGVEAEVVEPTENVSAPADEVQPANEMQPAEEQSGEANEMVGTVPSEAENRIRGKQKKTAKRAERQGYEAGNAEGNPVLQGEQLDNTRADRESATTGQERNDIPVEQSAVDVPETSVFGNAEVGNAPQVEEETSNGSTISQESEQDAGPVNMETLQLNMSEEDFNALLNSGDKAAISEYLAELDDALRMDENSPFAGEMALRDEYKNAVQQYGKENIPAEVMDDLTRRMMPYADLSRAIYKRKYALQDKLREIETSAEKATAAKEKEIKVENKNTAFGGFLADKTNLGASTAEKALNKKYNFDGKVMTVAEFVENAVANGDAKLSTIEEPKYKGASRAAWNRMDARQQEEDAKKVKESGTKTVYTVNDHDLGKTAYDYAKFLLDKKAEQEKVAEKEKESERVERIEDVGEKIGGAKKDKLRETIDRMKADMEQSDETLIDKIAKLPISKIFNFDFQKLREGGMPNEAISFMEIVKESIPAKPRTSHKVRRWVNNTLALYKLCLEVGTNWDRVNTILSSRDFAGTDLKAQFDAYMSVGGFDSGLNIGNAKLKQLDKTAGYYKDGKFVSSEGKWYVRDAGKHGGIYDTKEEAVEALKAFAGDNAGTTESGKKKEVKFAVYQRREDKSIFIAIKGKSDIVIQDGFKSAKEAFDYIEANNAELQSRYRNLLDKTNADFEENRERKGRDYRNGKDITAEEFRTTFGFRGVEFGNWMTQEDRRKAINECYDALMDLAAVCKVSPKALSLNGTLGMAFGSRGGGKFSAHYEPGKVVINLTKTRGAGTLAHEWFHAMDNYFAKMGETEFGYATGGEGMLPKGIQKYGKRYYDRNSGRVITEEEYNELAKEHAVRREMVDAWEHLMESLKNSDYYKRSNAYARLHNSKYWNDPTELGARAFSVWVENELSKQDTSNDYLANNPRYVKAEVTDAQDKYMPYPFDTDADWMDEAFGNLFEVMQERETEDGNVALYQRGSLSLDTDNPAFETATKNTVDAVKKAGVEVEEATPEMVQAMNELAEMQKRTAPETVSVQDEHLQTVVSSADGAKVLKDLDSAIAEYENDTQTKEKTFLGNLAKVLGAKKHGSNSQYATFEAVNGKVFTIRLANHNAKVSTFDNHEENEGISIVVTAQENNGVTNDGEAHVVEFFYDAIKLRKADGKPLVEILKSIKQALYSGEYKDNTGLAQREEVNIPDFLRTSDGTVYGWAVNGKIFLTPEGMNPNTPAHEYTHLWASMIEKNDPKLWSRIVEVMKESPTWNEVLLDEAYRDIHNNDSRMASEVLSRLSGEENYRRAMELAEREIKAADGIIEKAKKIALWGRIKQALADFWASVKGVFGFKDKSPWTEFVDMALGDLYAGVNPNAVGSPLERMFIGERGASNLDMAEEASLRLDNLNVAREMEEAGKGAKAIKLATGWERGADGKWRYEVMDDFAFDMSGNVDYGKRKPESLKEYNRYKELLHRKNALAFEGEELPADELAEFKGLEVVWRGTKLHNSERLKDFIDAPELFEAYPELRNVAVKFDDLGDNVFGQYSAARNEITINPNHKEVAIKSALAHEIQHAIQHFEGFAKGGNTESVRTKAQELRRDVAPLYEMMLETPEWAEKQRLLKRWFDETDDAKIAEIEARVEEIDNSGVLKGIEALQAELQKKYGLDRTVGRIISSPYAEDAEIWNELPDSFNDRFEAYRSLAGEVESRNVQSRMGMTEEERRNSLAVETEDVAREDQVFIEENLGVSASEGKEILPESETGKENSVSLSDNLNSDKHDNTREKVSIPNGARAYIEEVARILQTRLGRGEKPTEEVERIIQNFNRGKTIFAHTPLQRQTLALLRTLTNKEIKEEVLPALETLSNKAKDNEQKREYGELLQVVKRFINRNERSAVIEELSGAKLGEEVPLKKIDELFEMYNSDTNVAELYTRVRRFVDELGLTFEFEELDNDEEGGAYFPSDSRIALNAHLLYAPYASQQKKASTIVHEIIHAVTLSAITAKKNNVKLSPRLEKAAQVIDDVFENIVKNNPTLVHEEYNPDTDQMELEPDYGASSVLEMVAELANPEFTNKLKKLEYDNRSVWQRIWDAIKSIFIGKDEPQSVHKQLSEAFDAIVENFDREAYERSKEDGYKLYDILGGIRSREDDENKNEQYADGSEFIVRGTDLSDGPAREPGEPEWKFKARREKWRRWVNSFVSTKDPVPEKPFQGADETDEEYRERLKAFNKGLKEWKKQVTKTDAGIDEMMEALYNGKSPEQTPEEEFTENVFRRYMGRDGGIEISKKGMRGIIRDEVIERRRLIETNNFEDVLFVNKVKDATTPEERKIIPFIIEGTYNGEVSPELAAVVKSVKDWFETVYQMLQAADAMHSSGKIKNYVTHIWDKERTPKKVYENYINTRSKYTNKRSIETYAEGIALGMVPKYDDVCDIMLEYGHIANEAVANKKFIDFLHELTVDGEPVLIDAKKSNPLYKKTTSEALEGYRVHKYVSGIVNTVLGSVRTPDVPEWASGIAHFYDIAGAFMKKVNLSLSFFHHGALIETAVGAQGPIKAGKTLFKNIIWDSIRTGKAPALANPEAARRAVNHLVQLGATSDYLAKDVQRLTGWLKKFAEELRDKNPNMLTDGAENVATFIDFLNYGFDEVLWTYLHDGLKIYAFDKYAKEIDEYCAKKGLDETDKDMLLNEAGQFVNDTFGGQFWELLDISPVMQKWLRRGLLSPDWTLSTIRQALSPFGFGTLYKDYEDKWYQRLLGGRGDKTDSSVFGRLMNMTEGVKLRRRLGVSFWTMAALTFIPAMNLLNAWRRDDDEEEELEKAKEKRKTDPNYKSPYELKYPNGMKWYDYTMVGNTLGHKTHLFGGRYDDGKEMYIRWGKQFRELPELFLGKDGFVFPGPMIDKLVGKVNPAAHAVLDFAGFSKDGWENVYMKDKIGWEKELGRVMSLVVRCMPYSIPFDEDKEFALTDLMMPSSKGYSRYKALRHFEEAIKSQDMDFVGEVYNACVANKLDAEKLLKAALSRVEAEAKSEYVEGVETLNDAFEAYPVSDVERKRSIRKKMLRLLEENRYKDFERADAEELVLKALSGDGDKASVSLPDVYLRMETPEDVVDDYKIKAIKMALAKVYKEWKGIEDIGARAEYERKHIKQLRLRGELNEVDRKITEQKRAMSENTKYADAYMNIIRETRRMFIERADNLGETVSQME